MFYGAHLLGGLSMLSGCSLVLGWAGKLPRQGALSLPSPEARGGGRHERRSRHNPGLRMPDGLAEDSASTRDAISPDRRPLACTAALYMSSSSI